MKKLKNIGLQNVFLSFLVGLIVKRWRKVKKQKMNNAQTHTRCYIPVMQEHTKTRKDKIVFVHVFVEEMQPIFSSTADGGPVD